MKPNIDGYNMVDRCLDYLPAVKYPRTPAIAPARGEQAQRLVRKTRVEGAPSGPLKGKKIALKDNVMVAGVPMMNGASTLEGYVPEIDATVVTRILDAGGNRRQSALRILLCVRRQPHRCDRPVHNPYKMGYSAGGSSSGSGVLVALGEADMAIGGDQGGSIRMPSSCCGVYGMKPTHGLVPYTGIMPIEIYIDHTGPMTGTVRDNALLLEVIAGPDNYDPRQYAPRVQPYTQMLEGGVRGLKIAVVKEGFGHPNQSLDVDEKYERPRSCSASWSDVTEVSIPWHLLQLRFLPSPPRDCADHDVGRWLWRESPGPVRHQSHGLPLAAACQRTLRDREASDLLGMYIQSSTAAATMAKRST